VTLRTDCKPGGFSGYAVPNGISSLLTGLSGPMEHTHRGILVSSSDRPRCHGLNETNDNVYAGAFFSRFKGENHSQLLDAQPTDRLLVVAATCIGYHKRPAQTLRDK